MKDHHARTTANQGKKKNQEGEERRASTRRALLGVGIAHASLDGQKIQISGAEKLIPWRQCSATEYRP